MWILNIGKNKGKAFYYLSEKKKLLQFAYMEDSKSIDNLRLEGTFLEGELIKVEITIILF